MEKGSSYRMMQVLGCIMMLLLQCFISQLFFLACLFIKVFQMFSSFMFLLHFMLFELISAFFILLIHFFMVLQLVTLIYNIVYKNMLFSRAQMFKGWITLSTG